MKCFFHLLILCLVCLVSAAQAEVVWYSPYSDATWPTDLEACEIGEAQARVDYYVQQNPSWQQVEYFPDPPTVTPIELGVDANCTFGIQRYIFGTPIPVLAPGQYYIYTVPAPDTCASDITDQNGICLETGPLSNLGGMDDCEHGPGRGQGNPINVTTGNKYQDEMDFAGTGLPHSVSVSRTYNSLSPSKGLFGEGWSSPWDQALFVNSAVTRAIVRLTDGRGDVFDQVSDDWVNTQSAASSLVHEMDGAWTYVNEDDQTLTFDANGQLTGIQDREGRVITLGYVSNVLNTVTDSYGATLTFNITNGLVDTITTSGRVYEYHYDGNNNLMEVLYPDDTPGTSTDNPKRIYRYEDTNFPHALTGITDEETNDYATYEYDTEGRAYQSYHGNSVEDVIIDYTHVDDGADPRVTVTNALGKDTVYHLETINGVHRIKQVEGQPTTLCAYRQMTTTFDGNGYRDTVTDYKGNITDYDYDSRGLQNQRIEAKNTTVERIISTTWETNFRLPNVVSEPERVIDYDYYSDGKLQRRKETLVNPQAGDPAERTRTYTYRATGQDGEGRIETINGPRTDVSDITTFGYHTDDLLHTVTDALGHQVEYLNYNDRGQPQTIFDANDVATNLVYAPRGWLEAMTVKHPATSSLDATTTFDYWDNGLLKRITLANGAYLDYGYDTAQRLITITNNNGEKIAYQLDAAGNREQEDIKDSIGTIKKTQSRVFDELSNLYTYNGANGQTYQYRYDLNDNLTLFKDGRLKDTQYQFDELDRLKKWSIPTCMKRSTATMARINRTPWRISAT